MSSSPPPPNKPSETDHDALPAGTRFGELEVVRVLGVGGFGIVYLARDHSLERDVALKEYMPASLASRGQGAQITVRSGSFAETYAVGLRSFVNEARLLARFDHPSMVKVHRFWEDNGTAYMVMQYLQGKTLREVRKAMTQPPDEAWIRRVLDPVLSAVDRLHTEGVYHRDIAPDNILLQPDAPPILLDFGAARRVISDRTQSLTAILKPSYAPIEQYAEMTSLRQGPWTDIYAIGAVIHFLLFGAPPSPATARAVSDDIEALASRTVPGVSPQFMAVMAWTLAVRPQGRPQNIEELRAALDGRLTPPLRSGAGGPGAAPQFDANAPTAFEPTLRVEGSYSEPTRADTAHQPTQRIAPPPAAPRTATQPQPRGLASAEAAAGPAPAPLPARRDAAAGPRAGAAEASSGKGAIFAGIAVAVLLVAGAGYWLFGGQRAAPSAPPSAAISPEPPVAAAAPTPAAAASPAAAPPAPAPAAVSPPPPATAVAPVAAAPAAPAPVVQPAPTTTPPKPVAQPTTQPPAVRTTAADSGALKPRPAGKPGEPATATPAAPSTTLTAAPSTSTERPPETSTAANPAADARPKPSAAPATVGKAPEPAPAPGGPATAREACGARVLVALNICLERECRNPRYKNDRECVRLAEERRRRDLQ
jgi:serine/threonine protein kinase